MFTEYQIDTIEKAKNLGFGYRLFGCSVEKQGWCSPKQEQALSKMVSAGEYLKNNRSCYGYCPDISDHEAMRSGDFFKYQRIGN